MQSSDAALSEKKGTDQLLTPVGPDTEKGWSSRLNGSLASTLSSLKSKKHDGSGVNTDKEGGQSSEEGPQSSTEETYPQGFRLIMVVIALVLSIFLVALDMVRTIARRF